MNDPIVWVLGAIAFALIFCIVVVPTIKDSLNESERRFGK